MEYRAYIDLSARAAGETSAGVSGEASNKEGRAYLFDRGSDRMLRDISLPLAESGMPPRMEFPEGTGEAMVSVPLSWLNLRVIELGLTDIERIREVLPFELEGLLLGSSTDFICEPVILSKDTKSRVMAVCISKERLRGLIAALGLSGMDPCVVTSSELGALIELAREGRPVAELAAEGIKLDEKEYAARAGRELEAPSVNLRQAEFSYTRDTAKLARVFMIAGWLLAGAALFLSAALTIRAASLHRDAGALEARVTSLSKELLPGENPSSAKGAIGYKAEARLKELRTKDAGLRSAPVLDALMKLQTSARPGFTLNEITLDSRALVLKGSASSLDDLQKAKEALARVLSDVAITESGASASGGVGFTITARQAEK